MVQFVGKTKLGAGKLKVKVQKRQSTARASPPAPVLSAREAVHCRRVLAARTSFRSAAFRADLGGESEPTQKVDGVSVSLSCRAETTALFEAAGANRVQLRRSHGHALSLTNWISFISRITSSESLALLVSLAALRRGV